MGGIIAPPQCPVYKNTLKLVISHVVFGYNNPAVAVDVFAVDGEVLKAGKAEAEPGFDIRRFTF